MTQHFPIPAVSDYDLGLQLQYQVKTEIYDRALPGAFSRIDPDSWMPALGEPTQRSLRYARRLHEAQNMVRIKLVIPVRERTHLAHGTHAARLRMLTWHMTQHPDFWRVALRMIVEQLKEPI